MSDVLDAPVGGAPPATPFDTIDAALQQLAEARDAWANETPERQIELIDEIRADLARVAQRWVNANLVAKGAGRGNLAEAEEWIFVAGLFRALRMLRGTLATQAGGAQPAPAPDEQGIINAFPRDRWDRLVYRGITGEVWLQPGAAASTTAARSGAVALVLGAGNASTMGPIDVLHKVFVEKQVVVFKPNPVNVYLAPLIERAFAALIRRGCLAIVHGGAEEGNYLCNHPLVDELHLTGSHRTFESITFGPGPEGAARRAARTPLNPRRFTSELGSVSPVIIVPGPWSTDDLREWAMQVATWLTGNAGFGCLTPRMLVQHTGWPLRHAFMGELARALTITPTRPAFYPGAFDTHRAFVEAHPEALRFGDPMPGHLPWTVIPGVDASATDDPCFQREAFCGLLGETALDAPGPAEFLGRAVEFANSTLWGTLCVTLLVHPASLRDPGTTAAFEDAVRDLRYGTVAVNTVPFLGYFTGVTPWGAYPGHEPWDIQSGTGKVGNALMLDGVEKSVIRAPFRRWPGDPVHIGARRAHRFARRLASFEVRPHPAKMHGLLWAALDR